MLDRALALLMVVAAAAAKDIPNIVFVLMDDIGWADVSYQNVSARQYQPGAGGTRWTPNPPRTPHIDAMAHGAHSLLFHRFYAGSAVCSPTRASMLSGRSPDRECISGAEGCGQQPAWKCSDNLPFPPTTFTIAEAAKKAGMATIHVGKWHLGNFWPKANRKRSYVNGKWPASHPGMLGFDEWHSTEASASSSMCNCGCRAEWVSEGKGCVTGDGVWEHKSFECTNYWFPTDVNATVPACHDATTTTRDCVANLTAKIPGDDSEHIMDVFEEFLARQTKDRTPFLAQLWLHTNHEPHPAMPQYYHAYTDVYGKPAGDYLGTLTQMDAQIGRLRAMLRTYGVADNTMLWLTADNGPHPGDNLEDVRSATNGLRQCKASLFEGGIREPGILEWPAAIARNRETSVPAYVSDYLPTVLEVLGVAHPQPTWAADGESLLPLIEEDADTAEADRFARTKPLVFQLGMQSALISPSGQYKIVKHPEKGQCAMEKSSYLGKNPEGPFLFDLDADPTESNPLNKEQAAIYEQLKGELDAFAKSVTHSQQYESGCEPPEPAPSPPSPPFFLKHGSSGSCLTATHASNHAALALAPCDADAAPRDQALSTWTTDGGALQLADGSRLFAKLDNQAGCGGKRVWLGIRRLDTLGFDNATGTLPLSTCPGQCLSATSLQLDDCSAPGSVGWSLSYTSTAALASPSAVPVVPRAYSALVLGRDGTNNTLAISYTKKAVRNTYVPTFGSLGQSQTNLFRAADGLEWDWYFDEEANKLIPHCRESASDKTWTTAVNEDGIMRACGTRTDDDPSACLRGVKKLNTTACPAFCRFKEGKHCDVWGVSAESLTNGTIYVFEAGSSTPACDRSCVSPASGVGPWCSGNDYLNWVAAEPAPALLEKPARCNY